MTVPDPAHVGDADLMSIGAHCSHPECHQLDFLPFRCGGCSLIFCATHRGATAHACPRAAAAEVQVIVCPACARAVKLAPGEDPNAAFDRHARSAACDPANYDRVHRKQKCPVKGCKERLTSTNSLTCKDCGAAVCLRHRHGEDHACPGPRPPPPSGLRATLGGIFGSSGGKQAAKGSGSKPAAAAPGPSRLASAKGKVAAAARSASGSLQTQLQEYRAAHKTKTGGDGGGGGTAVAATVGSPAPERCGQCGQRFATVQQLIDHAAAAHADGWASGGGLDARPAAGGGGLERCPTCGAGFDDPVALVRHVETAHRTSAVSEVCVLI